jgi:cysteinyl-tRNA synthetase
MSITVYNYLTRRKEEFKPIQEGFVSIYVCGPTIYDHAHIGHAKAYVSFDTIVRYFRYRGYKVRYVQNITDVGHLTDDADAGDDKILQRAQRDRVEPMELVETYMRSYFEDMDALNVGRPNISPRPSCHISEQIQLAQELLERGHAYEANGSVYFDVSSWPEYGKLSGRRVEELEEGARVAVNPEKRHPADFAVWKAAEKGHILRWPSPWGWGYPGWHVECSVMATKYLGQPFDIHGGGLENIFPHNECEIAQIEAATGVPFCTYWLLNNMITVDGIKMGKSLGNAITIKEMLQRHDAMTVRFFILSSHYRSPTDFSEEALNAAARGLERLYYAAPRVRNQTPNGRRGWQSTRPVSSR